MELELRDGYRTAVCCFAGKSGRLPFSAAENGNRPDFPLPVLYLHGIQSHPGWFVGSAAHLAARGHPVYMVTRRGSGRNVSGRGHASSAGQLLADVDAACRFVLDHSSARRLHLLGVSWGGMLLAAFAARRRGLWPRPECGETPPIEPADSLIASLTLVAPGIVSRVDLPWWKKAAVGACAICRPRRAFDIPLSDPALFTDEAKMQEYLRRDGLSLRRATARFLFASRMLDRMIARAPRGAIHAATTLILASRDRIIDSAATREEVQRLTAGRCQVTELDGAHTLEFEMDMRMLCQTIAGALAWSEREGNTERGTGDRNQGT
jgi:alpha-beta hydrolase superfamily lysophospholipase